ncbi:Calcium-activated potassium channel subunit alpha-1 [Microtus ochrogaster]|uniref:Calcium-activated potassium channel subunit alpha-1 n=1 Tax=Microtus ochrogaster TaxID=79684 RepID=A0A8J6GTA8_MICOH|nr:Calcium-activated potassium channel subunit alpha-1 [Microtus ochrogaster]
MVRLNQNLHLLPHQRQGQGSTPTSNGWGVIVYLEIQKSPEKKWFTDEPDNAYPRNIQIKPMSTHMANQINQYKSTSSLIPPIREVEDEC